MLEECLMLRRIIMREKIFIVAVVVRDYREVDMRSVAAVAVAAVAVAEVRMMVLEVVEGWSFYLFAVVGK